MTQLAEIRLVVFDFDGVFSDNRVWTNDRGEESVACFRGDSQGLRRLDEVGVDYFILTSETNDAVSARARKIRAECIRGIEDKLPVLEHELERRGVSLAETAYVGNDVNDAECLAAVGVPVCRRTRGRRSCRSQGGSSRAPAVTAACGSSATRCGTRSGRRA